MRENATPQITWLQVSGTRTMTFSDECPHIDWTGTYDPSTREVKLIGRRVDPWALHRWADDGGRAP